METRPRSPKPTRATVPRKSLCYKAEPVGFEPTHPHGRRFSRPNGGVPLSTSKAVYGPFTTIFRGRLSGEGPLRPCKTR